MVAVLGEKWHAGAAHRVIRQPDGTLSLLPRWMTEPAASSCPLLSDPRLPVQSLADVRLLVDALVASSRGESIPEEDVGHEDHGTRPERSVRAGDGDGGAAAECSVEAGAAFAISSDGGRRCAPAEDRVKPKRQGGRR